MRRGVGGSVQSGSSGGAARTRFTFTAAAVGELRGELGRRPGEIEGVDVPVGGERRGDLRRPAGHDVDHAAGEVGGREDLAEHDRRHRARLGGDDDGGVPRHEHGGEHADEAEERRARRGEHTDDPGRLGNREVEVRARDGVRRAGHLRDLVAPSRVPDPAVDRRVDRGRGAVRVEPLARGDGRDELGPAVLEDLGDPVEDLAAVVGGRARPA